MLLRVLHRCMALCAAPDLSHHHLVIEGGSLFLGERISARPDRSNSRRTGWTTSFLFFGVFVCCVPGHWWPLSETTVHETWIYLGRWLSSRLGAVLFHTAGRVQAAFSSLAGLELIALSAHQILQGHAIC